MSIEDIKLISDENLRDLSNALYNALDNLKDKLGDDRLKSDMYVYLLQISSLFGDAYMSRELKKYNESKKKSTL